MQASLVDTIQLTTDLEALLVSHHPPGHPRIHPVKTRMCAYTFCMQALLCSIWTTDVSGSIALLGLFAVYMASQELLVLFMVFIPASILVDLVRGLGGEPTGKGLCLGPAVNCLCTFDLCAQLMSRS